MQVADRSTDMVFSGGVHDSRQDAISLLKEIEDRMIPLTKLPDGIENEDPEGFSTIILSALKDASSATHAATETANDKLRQSRFEAFFDATRQLGQYAAELADIAEGTTEVD